MDESLGKNQNDIKELLLTLKTPEIDFSVIFSGKKSSKANGLYKVGKKEIVMHNKNFTNDNQLIYTAIHEYAHHLMWCKYCRSGKNPGHTNEFWSLMYNLVDIAEEKCLYKKYANEKIKDEVTTLVDEVKNIDKEIATLYKALGDKLNEVTEKCNMFGIRAEDVYIRECGLTKQTVTMARKTAALNITDIGQETQKAILAEHDLDKAQQIIDNIASGKTIYQAKQSVKKDLPVKKSNQIKPHKTKMFTREICFACGKMFTRGICFACGQAKKGVSVANILASAKINKSVAKRCAVPERDMLLLEDVFDELKLASSKAN